MCVDQLRTKSQAPSSFPEVEYLANDMTIPTAITEIKYSFSILLELAADNDVGGFKLCISRGFAADEVGIWYGYQRTSRKMVLDQRTSLMIAAKYGSLDVLKFIISACGVDVNRHCGLDRTTALHCAASGGSVNSVDAVKLLLVAGADTSVTDADGYHPFDVIVAPPNLSHLKDVLEVLLNCGNSEPRPLPVRMRSGMPALLSSLERASRTYPLDSSPPRLTSKPASQKKEYFVYPYLPDIKSSIFTTDEFRMYIFKVKPCSRAFSHDWTECPFSHPGEHAQRRDPRKFRYSCVPCPEFKMGSCKRGELCQYAHGVFECCLHPAQYRTRLCKDGTSCSRRVCFFAHKPEEVRPLYVSAESAVSSTRSANPVVKDMAATFNTYPGSPSVMSSSFAPPISTSGNGMFYSSMAFSQQSVPTLQLPSNLQISRLRSSLNARDLPAEELGKFGNSNNQFHNDMFRISQPNHSPSAENGNHSMRSKILLLSNLDELFSAEVSSPRYPDNLAGSFYSPSQKPTFNQFQRLQNRLSPIKTNSFSLKKVDHPLSQASFGVVSPGRMSQIPPCSIDPLSPMSARLSSLSRREQQHQPQQLRSFSSAEFGSKLPNDIGSNGRGVGPPMSRWKIADDGVDWSMPPDKLCHLDKSYSTGHNRGEPNLSWVQSLLKESPPTAKEKTNVPISGTPLFVEVHNSNSGSDSNDSMILNAWLDQLQLDQTIA